MKAVYPVIFTETKDEKDTVLIEVPDIHSFSEGYGMQDAYAMARDLIELHCMTLEEEGDVPASPSKLTDIDPERTEFKDAGASFISLVDIDSDAYRRKYETESVEKSVTIPAWMDYEAKKSKINISKVLQQALGGVLETGRA